MPASEDLIRLLRGEREKTFEETNAQAVFESLVNLREFPDIHRPRWIWELLQNAADATDPAKGSNSVSICAEANCVRFSHDGAAFRSQEITRLIYHGSTKQDDPNMQGKFGSGFLAVHLISPTVRIRGVLEENGNRQEFKFSLDRSGDTSRAIKENMKLAWDAFEKSLVSADGNEAFTTSFECDLNDSAQRAVESGLANLSRTVPFVLAFVQKLREVSVAAAGVVTTWRRRKQRSVGDFKVTEILCERSDQDSKILRIISVGDSAANVALGILLCKTDAGWKVLVDASTPRLFYPLPLVNTHDFPIPVSIVSNGFEPKPERDGILASSLGESAERTERNWSLLAKVPVRFKALLGTRTHSRWEASHKLLFFGALPNKEWLDNKKLMSDVLNPIIDFARQKGAPPLVQTLDGGLVSVAESAIPIRDKEGEIYELAAELKELKARLPTKQLASDWGSIVEGWAAMMGKNAEALDETVTSEKLVTRASSGTAARQSLEELGAKLASGTGIGALSWLNRLFGAVPGESLQSFLRNRTVLPNQLGELKKESDLLLDAGVEDELKDICEKLGDSVRAELLHSGICEPVRQLFAGARGKSLSNDDCVRRSLTRVKGQAAGGNEEAYAEANVQLFRWLIDHDCADKLESYPILCAAGRSELRSTKPLLTPLTLWASEAQPFSDVFADHRRLHDKYASSLQEKHWKYLEQKGFVLRSLFVQEALASLDSHQLVEDLADEKEHKATGKATTASIAFFGELRDEIRRSRPKAKRFLQFLLRYVIKADRHWLEHAEVQCSCGATHRVVPNWMFLAKTYEWIPVGRNREEKPSAENIAKHLLDEELTQTILDDAECADFLLKLGIGVSELLRFKTPVEKRSQLDRLSARIYASSDAQTLASIETVLDNPDIREAVLAKKQEIEKVRHNQEVGRTVEQLLRRELESADIQVTRTGIGHDFELETDFIENGNEQLLNVSRYLLEIKSTSMPFARMTLRQGEEATKPENWETYALCVVDVAGSKVDEKLVREKSRFVVAIGPMMESAVKKAKGLKHLEEEVTYGGTSAVAIDMIESSVKFRIGAKIWIENGVSFEQFVQLVKRAR